MRRVAVRRYAPCGRASLCVVWPWLAIKTVDTDTGLFHESREQLMAIICWCIFVYHCIYHIITQTERCTYDIKPLTNFKNIFHTKFKLKPTFQEDCVFMLNRAP